MGNWLIPFTFLSLLHNYVLNFSIFKIVPSPLLDHQLHEDKNHIRCLVLFGFVFLFTMHPMPSLALGALHVLTIR